MDFDNEKILAFELTNNFLKITNEKEFAYELKSYHLYMPPADGVLLDFIFETGGV